MDSVSAFASYIYVIVRTTHQLTGRRQEMHMSKKSKECTVHPLSWWKGGRFSIWSTGVTVLYHGIRSLQFDTELSYDLWIWLLHVHLARWTVRVTRSTPQIINSTWSPPLLMIFWYDCIVKSNTRRTVVSLENGFTKFNIQKGLGSYI